MKVILLFIIVILVSCSTPQIETVYRNNTIYVNSTVNITTETIVFVNSTCPETVDCADNNKSTEREKSLLLELLRCENRKVFNATAEWYVDEVYRLEVDLNRTLEKIDEIKEILE